MAEQLNFDADLDKCRCGRSPTGYCTGYHELSDEDWAKALSDNPAIQTSLDELTAKED